MTLYDRRYILHERLGAGAMGEVYRATDRLAGRAVALKRVLLKTDALATHDVVERRAALATEFQTLASLRHPNIISVLDYGFDGEGMPYFTMTLLDRPLTFARHAHGLSISDRMALVVEILRALAYLHRRGIVHRDLKPANVLIAADGRVRVVDFGLATAGAGDQLVAGTLGYMAPEVLRGEGASQASDLYAVGVMAYEVLTGVSPFVGADARALMHAVLHDAPDFELLARAVNAAGLPDAKASMELTPATKAHTAAPTEAITGSENVTRLVEPGGVISGLETPEAQAAPPAASLADVVRRLLSKDPRRRYPSAAGVIQDISVVLGHTLPAETADTRESFLQAAPLIGRDDERRTLVDALQEARKGRGRVLLLGGESGVGKSRLLDEVCTAALVRGVVVARGQAVSEGGAPYQVWREPLRELAVLGDITDFQAGVLKAVVPDLETLLGRPIPDPPNVGTDAVQERFLSVVQEVFRVSQPTLVVLEDLHWARESAAILRRLSSMSSGAPLLVIGSYRRDEAPGLPDEVRDAEQLNLDRLPPEAVGALADAMLGSIPGRDRLVEYLHRQTEGNAFFLVEVVRTLAERAGQLDEVAAMALPEHVLSGGMQQLIARRLDRVPDEHQPLLRLAAVLGRELDLEALASTADRRLDEWLLACGAASVVEVHQDRWRFSHDKLREALLARLSAADRSALHRQAAEGLEVAYPDRGTRAAALAYHWGIAGDPGKEAVYSVLGGRRAFDGAAYQEAVALLTRALELAGADSALPIEVAPTEHLLGEALFVSGRLEEGLARLERAVRHVRGPVPVPSLARTSVTVAGQVVRQLMHRLAPSRFIGQARTQDARTRMLLLSRAYERIGHCHYQLGRSLQTVCASLLNLNSSEQAGPSPELARSYGTQIVGAGMVGQHRMARMYMRLAREAERAITDQTVHGWIDLMAVTYLVGAAGWREMDDIIPRATAIQEGLGDRRRLQETVMVGACGDYFRGQFARSLEGCDRVTSLAVPVEGWQPRVWSAAGQIQAALASVGAAEALRMAARDPVVKETWHGLDGIWLSGAVARCHLRAGDLASARRESLRTLELMPTTPPVAGYVLEGYAGPTETWLALWAAAHDHAERVEAHATAKRCLATLRRFAAMFPVGEPRAALCQGLYEHTAGRKARAAAALERSLTAAERLEMPYEAGRAAHELGSLLGPDTDRGAALLARACATFEAIGASDDLRLAKTSARGVRSHA